MLGGNVGAAAAAGAVGPAAAGAAGCWLGPAPPGTVMPLNLPPAAAATYASVIPSRPKSPCSLRFSSVATAAAVAELLLPPLLPPAARIALAMACIGLPMPGSLIPAMSKTRLATPDRDRERPGRFWVSASLAAADGAGAAAAACGEAGGVAMTGATGMTVAAARAATAATAATSGGAASATCAPSARTGTAAPPLLLSTTSAVRISGRPSGWKCSARSERLVRRM